MPTNYLNAKNGIEILHDDGNTQILAGNEDPSISGLEASVGSIYLRNNSTESLYSKFGESDLEWKVVTGEGLTPEQHIAIHHRNKFTEFTYAYGRVSKIDEWEDNSKSYHISSTLLHRSINRIVGFSKDIYDYETGQTVIATVSGVVNRTNNKIQSISYSRDNEIGGL